VLLLEACEFHSLRSIPAQNDGRVLGRRAPVMIAHRKGGVASYQVQIACSCWVPRVEMQFREVGRLRVTRGISGRG